MDLWRNGMCTWHAAAAAARRGVLVQTAARARVLSATPEPPLALLESCALALAAHSADEAVLPLVAAPAHLVTCTQLCGPFSPAAAVSGVPADCSDACSAERQPTHPVPQASKQAQDLLRQMQHVAGKLTGLSLTQGQLAPLHASETPTSTDPLAPLADGSLRATRAAPRTVAAWTVGVLHVAGVCVAVLYDVPLAVWQAGARGACAAHEALLPTWAPPAPTLGADYGSPSAARDLCLVILMSLVRDAGGGAADGVHLGVRGGALNTRAPHATPAPVQRSLLGPGPAAQPGATTPPPTPRASVLCAAGAMCEPGRTPVKARRGKKRGGRKPRGAGSPSEGTPGVPAVPAPDAALEHAKASGGTPSSVPVAGTPPTRGAVRALLSGAIREGAARARRQAAGTAEGAPPPLPMQWAAALEGARQPVRGPSGTDDGVLLQGLGHLTWEAMQCVHLAWQHTRSAVGAMRACLGRDTGNDSDDDGLEPPSAEREGGASLAELRTQAAKAMAQALTAKIGADTASAAAAAAAGTACAKQRPSAREGGSPSTRDVTLHITGVSTRAAVTAATEAAASLRRSGEAQELTTMLRRAAARLCMPCNDPRAYLDALGDTPLKRQQFETEAGTACSFARAFLRRAVHGVSGSVEAAAQRGGGDAPSPPPSPARSAAPEEGAFAPGTPPLRWPAPAATAPPPSDAAPRSTGSVAGAAAAAAGRCLRTVLGSVAGSHPKHELRGLVWMGVLAVADMASNTARRKAARGGLRYPACGSREAELAGTLRRWALAALGHGQPAAPVDGMGANTLDPDAGAPAQTAARAAAHKAEMLEGYAAGAAVDMVVGAMHAAYTTARVSVGTAAGVCREAAMRAAHTVALDAAARGAEAAERAEVYTRTAKAALMPLLQEALLQAQERETASLP